MLGTDEVHRKHYALVSELKNACKVNSGRGMYKFEFFTTMQEFQQAVAKAAVVNHKCLCVQSEIRHCREVLALTWRTHAADLRCQTMVTVMSEFYRSLGLVHPIV